MRKIALLLCLAVMLALCMPVSAQSAPFAGREEFYFGISGHHRHYEAYPEDKLDEQIRLAAELGSGLYRINCVPTDEDTFAYLDRVLSLCLSYDMEMMLVLDAFPGETEQEIFENGKTIAAHFGERLAFVQAGNELDNHCITSPMVDGSQPQHFNTQTYDNYLPKLKALLGGLKEGCTATKTVVNIAYRHYGFLQRLVNDSVQFDVVGWDWYSNMGDYKEVFPTLLAFQKPVIICETNIWDGIGKDSAPERTDYLTAFMNYIYHYPSDQCLGFLVYELMDEPAFGENSNVEAHFGLIDCKRDGTVIAPKQAYYDIQKLWVLPEPQPPCYGDVNTDDTMNANDALLVLKAAVGKTNLTDEQVILADVNGDTLINANDALLILRRAVDKIPAFPVELKK